MAMPTWVRQAAWDMLRGTVSWGADRAAFAPADGYCRFCRPQGRFQKDNDAHFAMCPRNDAVWLAVEIFLIQQGGRQWCDDGSFYTDRSQQISSGGTMTQ
jgi:hypothetical protein